MSGTTDVLRCLLVEAYGASSEMRIRLQVLFVLLLSCLLIGCASNSYESRPFFQHEYAAESHGQKNILDRIIETDPGGFRVETSPQYLKDPPERIDVLPFADIGSANFVVDKIALTHRSEIERANWAWTDSQRFRRSLDGYLALPDSARAAGSPARRRCSRIWHGDALRSLLLLTGRGMASRGGGQDGLYSRRRKSYQGDRDPLRRSGYACVIAARRSDQLRRKHSSASGYHIGAGRRRNVPRSCPSCPRFARTQGSY